MSNAWLQKQRKGELAEIADYVGLKNVDRYKKIDLEVALEEYLRAHWGSLSQDPKVAPFFAGVDPLSPVKREPGSVEEKVKRPRRQTLKAREDLEAPDTSTRTALTSRTPNRALSYARSVPLPPSPAVLADKIDAQTSSLRTSLSTRISNSPLPETLTTVRSTLSSVTSIELLTLSVEAWGLRAHVLPLRYLTTLPAVPALGLTTEFAIKIPDLFALLTLAFWGPVGLWFLTSIALPLLGGWFINLKGEGGYDAVSFNAVKALVSWVVYVRNGVSGPSKAVVEKGVPGGSAGMLIGAGIGGLAGLYEAVLRR